MRGAGLRQAAGGVDGLSTRGAGDVGGPQDTLLGHEHVVALLFDDPNAESESVKSQMLKLSCRGSFA